MQKTSLLVLKTLFFIYPCTVLKSAWLSSGQVESRYVDLKYNLLSDDFTTAEMEAAIYMHMYAWINFINWTENKNNSFNNY